MSMSSLVFKCHVVKTTIYGVMATQGSVRIEIVLKLNLPNGKSVGYK